MNIGTFPLLAIYFAIIFVVLGFLALFVIHITPLQKYNENIKIIQKIFLIFIAVITIAGAIGIIFGKDFSFQENAFDISIHNRLDF